MTTATASPSSIFSRLALWVSAVLFLAAAIAVTLVLALSSNHHSSTISPQSPAQRGNYNQVCVPAPNTRFC